MDEKIAKIRGQKTTTGILLGLTLLLLLIIQGAAYAENGPSSPHVDLNDATAQITSVEIHEGGANGTLLTSLVGGEQKPLLLEQGKDYTLTFKVHKTSQENTEGYVRLRFGNEDENGNVTYNGLVFKNPPGSLYTQGQFSGHSYLDEVVVRTDAPDPAYGTSTYSMQDGVFIYHEKSDLQAGHEVIFHMQFTVDDVGYDGSGWLTDGIQLQTGTMDGTTFKADATLTASLPVKAKPTLQGSFSGTSKTATLGGDGQQIAYAARETNNATEFLGFVYTKSEFDIVYPQGATIGDFGFDATYAKTDEDRGQIRKVGNPVENADGTLTQHFETTSGYKNKTIDPAYYYYLTFPQDKFSDGQKVSTSLQNLTFTCATGTGGEIVIAVQDPATPATYTIVDPTKDATGLEAVNRTMGDGVYNATGAISNPQTALTPLGSCKISNNVSTETPFEKTYEAQFNTTNTAAAITYITVPLGITDTPTVEITGKTATGAIETRVIENPLDYAMNGRNSMLFRAEDFNFVTFTSVKAEIGKLWSFANTVNGAAQSFELSCNLSGAYGYFTTDEPGIVVQNTYRLYNTEPAYQQYAKGDLSVTSQAVSSTEARLAYAGTEPGIYDAKGQQTVSDVSAGDEVLIRGMVNPHSVPYEEGYRTSQGASANVYGNTAFITHPVLLVTLPKGMTLNTDDLSFRVAEYNYSTRNTVNVSLDASQYTVENISYLNQSSEDMNLYKITFPNLTLGYMVEDTDGSNTTILRKQLSYSVKLKTSKSLETKQYYVRDLLGIASENPVTALPYSSASALCPVVPDTYGINGGRDYAAVLDTKYATTSFGVQQHAEVNIDNAVKVDSIGGSSAESSWLSYDSTDVNSILMMGRKTTGQYRLQIRNTSDLPTTNVQVFVPLPKAGDSLGAAFMYDDNSALPDDERKKFGFSMDVNWDEANLDGFTSTYVKLTENIDRWNSSTVPQYTVCEKAEANAILLAKDTVEAQTNHTITLNYSVDAEEDLPRKQNIFRNVFRYELAGNQNSGLGSYVACEIAEGTLSGTAFYDANRNGTEDEGETPLSGISVVVKDAQGKIQATTTDEQGHYEFKAIREEHITVTYALGGNTTYRFNVPAEGLVLAADKTSATYDTELDATSTMNVPLSTYWTLTYDGNGATSGVVPAPQEYDSDNAIAVVRGKPDNLTNPGHAFVSWNTEADGSGTTYQQNEQLVMTGDTTLYAQWEYATYTMYLDYQGAQTGNNGVTQLSVTYQDPFYSGLPQGLTKEGYRFRGWGIEKGSGGSVFNKTTIYEWTSDITAYAKWQERTYFTITYNTDGGTAIDERSNVAWTASVLPGKTPTKNGYDFAGWTYTDTSGTTVAVQDSDTYASLAKVEGSKTIELKAVWTPKTGFTVKYDVNAPDGATVAPASYDNASVSWIHKGLLPTQSPVCTQGGYAFEGWYYGESAGSEGSEVTAETTYADLANSDTVTEITLKAKWEKVENKVVHYNTHGGSPVNDLLIQDITTSGLIPHSAPTRPGYSLTGWTYGDTPVNADSTYQSLVGEVSEIPPSITLDANWEEKTYTIDYDYQNLADVSGKKWSESGLISDAAKSITKPGYTFSHWSYNGTVVTDETTIAALIPEDEVENNTIKLTPHWTERTYNVVYDAAEGLPVPPTKVGILYSAQGLLPDVAPTKLGSTFSHWAYQPAGGAGPIAVKEDTTIASLIGTQDAVTDITLKAVYEEKRDYTVKYDTQSGGEIPDKSSVSWTEANLLPSDTPVKPGYTLTGWSGGRVESVSNTTTYAQIAGDNDRAGSHITLVAQWSLNYYAITYKDANNTAEGADFTGTYPDGTVVPKQHAYNATTALPVPSKDGYDFAGWYTDSACTAESRVTSLEAERYTSDITLYAKWIKKTDITGLVKIVYTANGTTQTENQKTKNINLVLERKLADSNEVFTQVGDPLPVEFTPAAQANFAIAPFEFKNMPESDEHGNAYVYQVSAYVAHYDITSRGDAFGEEGDTAYNLLLTFNPDTFAINLDVEMNQNVEASDQPVAVNIRVAFRAAKPTDEFTGLESVVTSNDPKANPAEYPEQWIYVTEHENESTALKFGYGVANGDYYVHKWWNSNKDTAYFQFVIDSYVMADGTKIMKGSAEDPFTLTYEQKYAAFDESNPDATPELTVKINRTNTVSFDLMGGTATGSGVSPEGALLPQRVLGGEKATDPSDASITSAITKTGYTLVGWYTDDDYRDESKWNFNKSVSGDMTLYAKWEPKSYEITFDNQGGTPATNTKPATYDAALPTLSLEDIPTHDGKTFGGYFTEKNGQGDCYCDASGQATEAFATYKLDGNLTLYAYWTSNITIKGIAKIHYSYEIDEDGTKKTIAIPEGERFTNVTIVLERAVVAQDGQEPRYEVVQEIKDKAFGATDATTLTASCDYAFSNLPTIDGYGKPYEYRVRAELPNYDTTYEKHEDGYNLEFTFNPNLFDLPLSVDASGITTAADRPTAVNVQVLYRADVSDEPPVGDFTGASSAWPVVTQLNNGSIRLAVGEDGTASGTYPVWKKSQASDAAYTSYYQLHVYSYEYKTESGETVTVPANDTPYFVAQYGSYGYFDATSSEIKGVSVTIGRTYLVTFDTKGQGDTVPVAQNVAQGQCAQEPPSADIVEPGYHIAGWYTDSACTAGNEWDFTNDPVTENTTLYAKWEPNTYTIRFFDSEADIPTGEIIDSKDVTYNGTWPGINIPVKEGYDFAGYYFAGYGDQEECCYDADGQAIFDTYYRPVDLNVYAKWIEKIDITGKVKINYSYQSDAENSLIMPVSQRLESIEVVLERELSDGTFEQVGQPQTVIFDNSQNEAITFDTKAFTFENVPQTDASGNEYVYRVTTSAPHYDVAYNVEIDGATSPYNMELVFSASSFNLSMTVDATNMTTDVPKSVDVKVAFIWFEPTGPFDGVVDGNADPSNNKPDPDPTKWRYITEFISDVENVSLGNGTGAFSFPVVSEGVRTGESEAVPFYYQFVITAYHMEDGRIIDASDADSPFIPTWNEWYACADFIDPGKQALTITLHPACTVSYDLQGKGKINGEQANIPSEKVQSGSALSAPDMSSITEPGYTFAGWYTDAACSDGNEWVFGATDDANTSKVIENMTLYAKWVANSTTSPVTNYKVEHYLQNLDESYPATASYTEIGQGTVGTPVTADTTKTYEGFTYDAADPNNVTSGTITAGDEKLVLKLYYSRNSYQVTYDYGAAPANASTLPAQATYKFGEPVTVADNATAPGYSFSGWTSTSVSAAAGGTFMMPAENITIEGSWTANTDIAYTVEYYLQNIDESYPTTASYTEIGQGTVGTQATADTTKTYEGFTYDAADPNNVTSGTITAGDEKLVLKLYYSRNSYQVTYDYGAAPAGASALPNEIIYLFGQRVTVADNATAPGYSFSGWTSTSVSAAAGDTFMMPAENITIKGVWTAETYGITYDLAGGVTSTPNPASYTIEDSAITLVNPTREGYTFLGWTGTDLTEPTMQVVIPAGSIGDRTYTATWQKDNDNPHKPDGNPDGNPNPGPDSDGNPSPSGPSNTGNETGAGAGKVELANTGDGLQAFMLAIGVFGALSLLALTLCARVRTTRNKQ